MIRVSPRPSTSKAAIRNSAPWAIPSAKVSPGPSPRCERTSQIWGKSAGRCPKSHGFVGSTAIPRRVHSQEEVRLRRSANLYVAAGTPIRRQPCWWPPSAVTIAKYATSAAAYQAGERIRDIRTGKIFDQSQRRDILYKEIMLPARFEDSAMDWARDRPELWNAAELAEVRTNQGFAWR